MSADGDTVDKHLALPIDSAEMQNAALIIKAAVESEPLSVPKALVWLKRALTPESWLSMAKGRIILPLKSFGQASPPGLSHNRTRR